MLDKYSFFNAKNEVILTLYGKFAVLISMCFSETKKASLA